MIFDLATKFLFFTLTYIIFGCVLYPVIDYLTGKFKGSLSFLIKLAIAFAFAPVLVSFLLYLLFFLIPGESAFLYVFCIILVFTAIAVLFRRSLFNSIFQTYKEIIGVCGRFKTLQLDKKILLLGIFVVFVYIIAQGIGYLIVSHDGSVYYVYSKIFASIKSLNNYPTRVPDELTGFYCPIKHLPGLPLLYTWFHFLTGEPNNDFLARTVCPVYAIYLAFILSLIIYEREKNIYASLFGVIILASTPAFVWQSIENSIDTPRMAIMLISVYMLARFVEKANLAYFVLMAISLWFSIYLHSSGLLIAIVAFFILFIFKTRKIFWFLRKHYIVSAFCLIIAFLGGKKIKDSSYLSNYLKKIMNIQVVYDSETYKFYGIKAGYDYRDMINSLLCASIVSKKGEPILITNYKISDAARENIKDTKIYTLWGKDFYLKELMDMNSANEAYQFLKKLGIGAIVIDERYSDNKEYIKTKIPELFKDSSKYMQVFSKRGFTVYVSIPEFENDKKAEFASFKKETEKKINEAIENGIINVRSKYDLIWDKVKDEIFSPKTYSMRLQIFTNPQLFGISYFIFMLAVLYWLVIKRKNNFDNVLFMSIVLISIPILYKYYLNRRYILTVLPLTCYFSGIFLGEIYNRLKVKKAEYYLWIAGAVCLLALIVFMLMPNQLARARLFKGDEGILKYILSSKIEQNDKLYPGLMDAINYINKNTPENAIVVTSNNAQFYKFSKRKGLYWIRIQNYPTLRKEPKIHSESDKYFYMDELANRKLQLNLGEHNLVRDMITLRSAGYVLIDPVSMEKRYENYYSSSFKPILSNASFATCVFDKGTKVWKLSQTVKPFAH